jgi:hypothetical protein
MKRLLRTAAFAAFAITLHGSTASASSFEWVDQTITGPVGPSTVVLDDASACGGTPCVDPTGGDAELFTASAQQMAAASAMPQREINMAFARKFPDPAVPVPAPVMEGSSSDEGFASAPSDVGDVPPQPPVDASSQPSDPAMQGMAPGGSPMEQAAALDPNGAPDPNAPPVPLADAELRESN